MPDRPFAVQLLLQFHNDLSLVLVFTLILREPISEGVERVYFGRFREFSLVHDSILWGENTLADVFGVILNSHEGLLGDHVDIPRSLTLVVFLHSLLQFVAEDGIEVAIELRNVIDRVDVLGNRSLSTKSVKTLVYDVSILDVSANIGS